MAERFENPAHAGLPGTQDQMAAVAADIYKPGQSALRERLALNGTVGLICSDIYSSESDCTTPRRPDSYSAKPTEHESRIAADVEAELSKGKFPTTISFLSNIAGLPAHLLKDTSAAPMRIDQTGYWSSTTEQNEIKLVDALSKTSGEITQATMTAKALEISGGDKIAATLLLANFTKNMAAVERHQIDEAHTKPSLRSTYNSGVIDKIFNRIEGFSDDKTEMYNKEGTMYHFYGAVLAGALTGDSIAAPTAINDYFKRTHDHIENAAGLLGIIAGHNATRVPMNMPPWGTI